VSVLSWQVLHAMVAYLPLALGVIGIPMVFIGAVVKMDNPTLRWVIFLVYVFMALLTLPAVFTGSHALSAAQATMPSATFSIVETHEWMAEKAWICPLITAFLVLICRTKQELFRSAVATLAVLASVVTGIWIGIIGYHGWNLVYGYGVGTPAQMEYLPTQPPDVSVYPDTTNNNLPGDVLEKPEAPPVDETTPPANRSIDPDTGEEFEP